MVSRNTWLVVGFGLAFGLAMSFGLRHHPFPLNYIPLVVVPIIAYFSYKSHARRTHTFSTRHAIEVLDEEPLDASDFAERADVLSCYGFYESAVEDFRTALAMNPDEEFDADLTWYNLATTLQELDRDDEAMSILEKLCATEGHYQDIVLVFRGELLADKDPAEALKCFDKAIEVAPMAYENHFARLRFYIDTDRLDQAAEVIAWIPKNLKQHYQFYVYKLYELRGMLALKQGRFADAVRDLGWAIWNSPQEKEYYRLRADAHEALGNIDKAEKDRRKGAE
jgi:tetratricopeptide (TPR) repeat protein